MAEQKMESWHGYLALSPVWVDGCLNYAYPPPGTELEEDVFGVILILVVTLLQGYVFWRAASVPFIRGCISRKGLISIGVALWAVFLLGRVVESENTGVLTVALESLGLTWLAILFLTTVALLAVEVVTGFGYLLRSIVPTLRGLALVAGGLLSVVALIQGLRAPVVENYDVYLAGLPAAIDGKVILALSDLHLGSLLDESWLASRIEQIQAERPDVVVLLGDVFEGHGAPKKELLAALRGLSAPQGVWAVLGNHESHGIGNDNTALFKDAGIHLLRNAWVELSPGLVLAGVDDISSGREAGQAGVSLAKALTGRPHGATVLLSHAPMPAEWVADMGVDLLLCGHTHGGQIWPFGYLVRQRFPMLEGRFETSEMTVIVSRGAGTWGPRMRLWRPAEILRVTLHRETKKPTTQPLTRSVQ
jgi:predicted MPP superfamily phosphohydrolase